MEEVFRTDLGGFPIGACLASSTAISAGRYLSAGRRRKRTDEFAAWRDRLGFTSDEVKTEYFSPSVLLYDVPMIRRLDPHRRLADVELSRRHWDSQPDSDPLNVFFKGRIRPLDLKWNVSRDFLSWNRRFCSNELWTAVTRASAEPAILHFPGIFRRRPWRRPWYARRRRYRIYEKTCAEMEGRTGIAVRRLLDRGIHRPAQLAK